MQRLLYLIQKEFRQIVREKIFIGIIFVVPVLQLGSHRFCRNNGRKECSHRTGERRQRFIQPTHRRCFANLRRFSLSGPPAECGRGARLDYRR